MSLKLQGCNSVSFTVLNYMCNLKFFFLVFSLEICLYILSNDFVRALDRTVKKPWGVINLVRT